MMYKRTSTDIMADVMDLLQDERLGEGHAGRFSKVRPEAALRAGEAGTVAEPSPDASAGPSTAGSKSGSPAVDGEGGNSNGGVGAKGEGKG